MHRQLANTVYLHAGLDLHFDEFVGSFLVVERWLDGQVDGSPERHQVLLRVVYDRRRLLLLPLFAYQLISRHRLTPE